MSQYLDKDGTTRIAENFLSKQAEQDAILRNLQFDLKEAEHALVKTIQGPAPLNIRALTRPLDDYLISGNTIQDGTPTPEAPVDVVGCGVRTENLLYKKIEGCSISSGGAITANESFYVVIAKVVQGETYSTIETYMAFYTVEPTTGSISYDSSRTIASTFVAPITGYVVVRYPSNYSNVMLNAGSIPLPYEPYGYKLPLTCGGTEYPIYLGQVETTRRIKKLVLTGEEVTWGNYVNNRARFIVSPRNMLNTTDSGFIISDRYNSAYAVPQLNNNSVENAIAAYSKKIYIYTNGDYDIDTYKSYLAAQYAAGTPVTIWYILATPETSVVNEPLHKISNYADTISYAQAGVEISTTKGFNTITTNTTVLPSNIEVKGVINNA